MIVLVVGAHPDDEVLGCGGTIAKHAQAGDDVILATLADGVSSRPNEGGHVEELARRRDAGRLAAQSLGATSISFGDLPDNAMDTVPLLEIVRAVEQLIVEHQPSVVYTHHGGDLNVDHRITQQAVMTACRPQGDNPVRTVLFFESASSTEWQAPGQPPVFAPSWYVDISDTLELKVEALAHYVDEHRDWPHPRSGEAITHLARWRGATVGYHAAEAFAVGRHLV